VEGVLGSHGQPIETDFQLAGGPSVLFDAVIIMLSSEAVQLLVAQPAAVSFVHDAFSHLKVIGYVGSSKPLLDAAGIGADVGVVLVESGSTVESFVSRAAAGRIWMREPKLRPAL